MKTISILTTWILSMIVLMCTSSCIVIQTHQHPRRGIIIIRRAPNPHPVPPGHRKHRKHPPGKHKGHHKGFGFYPENSFYFLDKISAYDKN